MLPPWMVTILAMQPSVLLRAHLLRLAVIPSMVPLETALNCNNKFFMLTFNEISTTIRAAVSSGGRVILTNGESSTHILGITLTEKKLEPITQELWAMPADKSLPYIRLTREHTITIVP